MGTIFTPEIYKILKKAGYDCDSIPDDTWEEYDAQFEDECECFLKQAIEEKKDIIASEWASKLGCDKRKKVI